MVQINPTPPYYASLEAAVRGLTMEDRTPGRLDDLEPAPEGEPRLAKPAVGPRLSSLPGDPATEAVVLWGRCGYVPVDRIAAERDEFDQGGGANRSN